MLRSTGWCAALALFALLLAACGGGGDNSSNGSELNKEAQAACSGSAMTATPELPTGWPDMGEVTLTQQSDQGPTKVVEGYFDGDITAAHDDFKRELEASGFTVLFDELEADRGDSEVSWKGEGRSGQVALREECGSKDKIYVHITNRPA